MGKGSMIIKYVEWVNKTEENLFYQDLRATLDGVECGEMKKSLVNKWIARNGYRLNWKNYDLTLLN